MFCTKCGNEIKAGNKFCTKCGSPVYQAQQKEQTQKLQSQQMQKTVQKAEQSQKTKPQKEGARGKGLLLALVILLLVVVVLGAGVIGYLVLGRGDAAEENADRNNKESVYETDSEEATEQKAVSLKTTEQEAAEELREEEESLAADDFIKQFGIDPDCIGDYAANLDPYTYRNYTSEQEDFYFSYPIYLFNDVKYSNAVTAGTYGSVLEEIEFTGMDGSVLRYTLTKRTDGKDVAAIIDYMKQYESSRITDVAQLQNIVEEDYAKFIFTGYNATRDQLIYNLIRVDDENVMQMLVVFPVYTSSDDKLHKDYVTECLYRMCGFSGSTKGVESYEEYEAYWRQHL